MPGRQNGSATLWPSGRFLRGVYVPEKHLPGLRARQMRSMSRITGLILISNMLSLAAVFWMFSGAVHGLALTTWAVCGVFVSCLSLLKHLRYLRIAPVRRDNARALRDYTCVSIVMGLLWGCVPLIVVPASEPYGQMIIGVMVAAIMFAGGFMLSRIPLAAISFMLPTSAGMAAVLMFQPGVQNILLAVLMIYYLAVLGAGVFWTHRQFVEQYLGAAAIQEQSQLIGLLLKDFGESTSDSLWQTNAEGILQRVPLLSEPGNFVWSRNRDIQPGRKLTAVFCAGEARDRLEKALRDRHPFRDIIVPVKGKPQRWWSVTGKPLLDKGRFLGFRGVVADVTQACESENRIARMAHYDSLTGLPNRVLLREKLTEALSERSGQETCRAFLMLDLDNFKWVNDTLGHPAGDELLRQVSARMTSLALPGDMIARLGGDEFAMMITRTNLCCLEDYLTDFTRRMSEPYDVWGSTANCSASVGVRIFSEEVDDAAILLRHADLALYQSKRMGRAKWSMFTAELEEEAKSRLQIKKDLQKAIERNELRVHFQPIVKADDLRISACETLVRWEHPERGFIYPDQFIDHAEENGLITHMGEWVLRTALAEAKTLPEDIRICINISPLQIHSATLVSTLIHAVATNGIDPRRLELEITEAALMSNRSVTLRRLQQLRELGIRIALDDFGTGLSALQFLRAFPFDRIKIDRSYVQEIETREDARQIMAATVRLANSLGMHCTAEGVETVQQANCLRDLGCEELQGWFISRASSMSQLGHLIDMQTVEPAGEDGRNVSAIAPILLKTRASG